MNELPGGTLTFLFTDIEGSTALLGRLGRERYGTLLARHNTHLQSAIERHGGTEVDRQGDGTFSVFPSAGAALAAAVDAQRLFACEQWPEEVTVRVRMGLHTGEAVVASGAYIGMAIHVGARVGAAAAGGQVLLTSTTATIVEHELPEDVRLRDLGERRLKALERPVRLYAAELEGLAVSWPAPAPPPPPRRDSRLLERDVERAVLQALAVDAQSGAGRFVVVEGAAGLGKTSLLDELRAHGRDSGTCVLTARGGELEGEFAFGIVRQLFDPVLTAVAPEERAELLSGAAELAAPILLPAAWLPGETPGETSYAVLHGLYWLVANLALRRTTIVVVDDLHWADDPSLRWLAYLARRLDGLPLLVAAGTRPASQSRAPIFLGELLADAQVTVIRPGVLGRDSVASLTRTRLESDPDAAFVDALLGASGGNPLYLGALLDAAAAEHLEPAAANAPRMTALGPEAVVRSVSLRLARVPPAAAALARAAAVLGDAADLHVAAELAGLEPVAAGHAASTLVRAGILRRESPAEFVHPVLRTAVYDDSDVGDRMTAHRRAAELVLAAGAPPEHAAAHLLQTLPTGDAFVTTGLRRAAERAVAEGAPEAAVTYLRRALAEPPGDAFGDVLAELGLAERLVDVTASVEHLGTAIPLAVDPARRGELVLAQSNALWLANRSADAVELLRDELSRPLAADLRELILADLVGLTFWHPELHRLALEELAHVDEEALEGGLGTDCLVAILAELEARQGVDRPRTLALALRSLASGRLVRQRPLSLFSVSVALLFVGELDRLEAVLADALACTRRAGDLPTVASLVLEGAWVAFRRGDLVEAGHKLEEFAEMNEAHGLDHVAQWTASLVAGVALARGRPDEAARALGDVGPVDPTVHSPGLSFFLDARARLRLEQRRAEEALADFVAAGDLFERTRSLNPANCPWRSGAACALDALGRRGEALDFARTEVERARTWGEPAALGIALQVHGRIEGGATGLETLHEAVDVLAESPARLEHARALVEFGAALRRANNRRDARRHLRDAIDAAHACGATPLVDRANDEIAATGAHRRTVVLGGVDSLTASERRVAQMAAEEMSNKEIAQALFVTVKTVEVHLSNAYRKLEIGSRRELPAALYAQHRGVALSTPS